MKPIMNDAKVKQAIRTLKVKGITIREIEQVYSYYDKLERYKKEYKEWETVMNQEDGEFHRKPFDEKIEMFKNSKEMQLFS